MGRESSSRNFPGRHPGHVAGGIEETRRIMTNLRPSMLDDLGIVVTLNWICRSFKKSIRPASRKGCRIRENEIPESLKIVIFRVLQEA